jgi:EAL domain-containing protein (putative c-di-GMP-specific phosphodiesterase class I)/CheY-like chemotaxis protein
MANHKQLVMIVDDREINRMMLKAMLLDTYNVAEAGNGQEALESLKQYGTSVKAILLDLIMPVMDGHEFLTAIKKTPYADVPVIILTGADDLKVEEQSLKDGACDFISKPYQPMVLKRRLQNAIDHSALNTLHLIQHIAEHDSLTDLYNRGYFFLETHKMLVGNPSIRFTFVRCDIERFHNLNSYWGDEGGNAFLKYLAEFFRQQEDQYSHITYGRITADVFCMCIPSSECNEEMILKALQDRIAEYNSRIFIKPILGIYEIDENEIPVEQIYARASTASQKCKSQHMQNIWHFDDKMRIEEMDEEEIISEMKEALETGQFVAYYQPKYSLKTNRMYGAEALVRWISPERGVISPGKFIPVFEKNGFIVDLDLYMWNTVAAQLKTWIDAGYHPTPISVNISRVSINNPSIVQVITDIVKKNNIPPSLFSLEITESAYMDNPEIMTDIVKAFQKNGFTVMMDDFGSGYSSLNTLKNIPVDILKIDMKFIEGEDQEGKGRIILSSVIRMAGLACRSL